MGTQQRGKKVLEVLTVIPTKSYLLGAASPLDHLPFIFKTFFKVHFQDILK